jgi:hypothetical protein
VGKANTTNQIVSLPQGGGALHGIGETFSPDLHTGTGNFTVRKDGLVSVYGTPQDIVRIHNARVEYWPYRGYGRWGRRVTMRNSPRFEDSDFFPGIGFDPKRALLGDGMVTAVADLVYVSSGHITVWINQDGNAWSDPIVIHAPPPVTDAAVR